MAIASPEAGGGELLDYEAELARIVAAVEPARERGEAYVRVLNEGSLAPSTRRCRRTRRVSMCCTCRVMPGRVS